MSEINVTVVVSDNAPRFSVTAVNGSQVVVSVDNNPIQIHAVENGVFDLPESLQSIALTGDVIAGSPTNPNAMVARLARVLDNPGEYDAPRIKVDATGRIVDLVDTTGGTGSHFKKVPVEFDGDTEFSIPAVAREVVHVFINQLDYAEHCAISPPGSGNVVYTVPTDGYTPVRGDSIVIHWR